jgi:hypothetical protein
MFDLNQILSAALNAAVAEAIKPLVERMGLLEAALADRHERIAALENNPAIGVDTTLEARVVALEQRVANATEASENRIRVIAEAAAEQVLDNHCETYDHDQYDEVVNEWGSESTSEFVRESDIDDKIEEQVNETLRNATVSISI